MLLYVKKDYQKNFLDIEKPLKLSFYINIKLTLILFQDIIRF